MRALLISTYEMGRQPFGLASPAAWLREAGWEVACLDLTRERLDRERVAGADLVGFHLPMHTATRLATAVIRAVRQAQSPGAPLRVRSVRAAQRRGARLARRGRGARREFEARADRRRGAPGGRRSGRGAAAAADCRACASSFPIARGCRRSRATPRCSSPTARAGPSATPKRAAAAVICCRHCPIVPVYEGQFRVVQPDVVLADIAAQVAAGARHITFGDPDFFNGPSHALAHRPRAARGASRRQLRRDDQGRAPAAAPRSPADARRRPAARS